MHAFKVLEFHRIQSRLQSQCETAIAAASAIDLKPSFATEVVWEQLELTRQAMDALARFQVPGLGAIKDIRDGLKRASKGGVLGGIELVQVGEALATSRNLRTFLLARREDLPKLSHFADGLIENKEVEAVLLDSFESSGELRDDASATLLTLRQRKKAAASKILERIQSYTTGKTRDLLSDPIYTVRDGRYVVPLKAENRGKIRGIVHDSSGTGQTIYVEPEEIVQLSNALREIESAMRVEEHKILAKLSDRVGKIATELRGAIETASDVDLIFARARLGFDLKGIIPERIYGHSIDIKRGRHPLIEVEKVVPVDIAVSIDRNILITGPNTGGKTVAIKAVGLFVLMAQCGIPIPALEARLGCFTQIWADIGDEQSLEQSLSTFSGHLKNIAEAIKWMKRGALILLDEVGAGTDPAEGASLAKAILLEMHRKGGTILASTHYGELKEFAYNHESFDNAAMEFDSKTLRPTYRLMMGAPGASHALRIAERYGIPKEVVENAKEYLGAEKQDIAAMLERLEQAQKLARMAQSEADKRSDELKKAEQRAQRKLAEADEIRKSVHNKANDVIEAALREIRLEAERLFDELKKQPQDQKTRDRVRAGLKDVQEVGHAFAQEFVPRSTGSSATHQIEKGMAVKIEGYSQGGTVLETPERGKVLVQAGPLKLTVPVNSLTPIGQASIRPAKTNVRLQKAMTATGEVHLRNMRAEDAERDLEKFIDDAVLAGLSSVRIVHGKGEGILRKLTQDYLRRNANVTSYRDGEPAEGGHGVTIANFS